MGANHKLCKLEVNMKNNCIKCNITLDFNNTYKNTSKTRINYCIECWTLYNKLIQREKKIIKGNNKMGGWKNPIKCNN